MKPTLRIVPLAEAAERIETFIERFPASHGDIIQTLGRFGSEGRLELRRSDLRMVLDYADYAVIQ